MRFKTLLFTVAVVSMAAAVFAQDASKITPYASVRYFIGAYYRDKDFSGITDSKGKKKADIDMVNSIVNTSRLGVKFEKGAVSGEAQVHLGPGHGGMVQDALIYGTFKSSFGLEVMAGQTEAPFAYQNANEAWDQNGNGLGSSQYPRSPQLMISFTGFYVDFIRAPRFQPSSNIGYEQDVYGGRDVYMPLTAVGYELKSDLADIGIGAAGFKYSVKDTSGSIKGDDRDAWTYIGYLHGTIKLGAPYIKFNATYQKSPYMLGMQALSHFNSGSGMHTHALPQSSSGGNNSSLDSGNVMDAFFEGYIEFGFKTEFGTLAVNAAYEKNLDAPKGRADRMAAGLNFAIPIVSGFKVTPTALYMNQLKNRAGVKQGSDLLAGLKLQWDL